METKNESLLKIILDIYSEKTGIPIAFVYNDQIIRQTSKSFCSSYCIELNKLFPERCFNDHIRRSKLKEEKLTMCHAGLWNYIRPINKEGKHIGALLIGQRRLHSKDKESLEILTNFQNKIPQNQYSVLKQRFYETPLIDEFDINLLKALKIIEEQLFEVVIASDIEKRKILNLAHEFLLPIQSIIANAENLYNELSQERGELKEQAEEIMRQVIKLGKTAENMRSNLMGVQHEKFHYMYESILKLLEENIEIFRSEALRKNVDIKADIQDSELPMSYEHLSRAFFNLIHNAVKYSYFSLEDKNRYIEIFGKDKRDYYRVEITNYGIGILEEEIKKGKIFLDGYRGILSCDRERTGSGIGLSEAKRIIEKHGGDISISSIFVGYTYLFSWDDISGNDRIKLIDFLNQNFGVDWVKDAKIEKINSRNIRISDGENFILLRLDDDNDKVIVTTDEDRNDELIVRSEKGKLNIYGGNKFSGPYLTTVLVKLPKFR